VNVVCNGRDTKSINEHVAFAIKPFEAQSCGNKNNNNWELYATSVSRQVKWNWNESNAQLRGNNNP